MNKAQNANRITEAEMVAIKLSDYGFDHRLISLRSQKSHATRWINGDLATIKLAERILATTPDDGTDLTAVRRTGALEMAHRYNLSLDRHRAERAKVELEIAQWIAYGRRLVAEREATIAKEQAAAKEVAR